MHRFLMELFLNDENGNPLKGRDGFFYFDNEIALQNAYDEKHDVMQTQEVTETVTDGDGNETSVTKTVNSNIRKWTIKISESKYCLVNDVDELFKRERG